MATANSALSGISGVTVTSVHQAIQDDLAQARLGASMTMGIMLIFPAIAALVASIVVSSTFRVVLTQRTRELALLRTLGATRRQVRSLVTREPRDRSDLVGDWRRGRLADWRARCGGKRPGH